MAHAHTGIFTINLNGEKKTINSGNGFNFYCPSINLLNLFDKVVNKTDNLSISFKVINTTENTENKIQKNYFHGEIPIP